MKNKKVYYITSFILLFLIVVIGVGVFYKLTNGFKEYPTSFVVVNSKGDLVINGSNELVNFNKINKFEIQGLNSSDFQFNIYGNKNLKYKVDGIQQDFSEVKQSLNSFFDVSLKDNLISFTPKLLAKDIVYNLYNDTTVTFDELTKINGDYFTCKVTSNNDSYSFNIHYDVVSLLNFDKDSIIFV